MTSNPTQAQVLQALEALYIGHDAATKEQANRWLEEFQNTVRIHWKWQMGISLSVAYCLGSCMGYC
jgi:hypothetical protein